MSADGSIFPLEFHLAGTPVSLQGRPAARERWKNALAEAARERIAATVEWTYLGPAPVAVVIYCFPTASMAGDVDNIVKPILDALIGVAYPDDRVVERILVQKFEPSAMWNFSAPSEQLSAALDATFASELPQPVVYVQVANDLRWRRL